MKTSLLKFTMKAKFYFLLLSAFTISSGSCTFKAQPDVEECFQPGQCRDGHFITGDFVEDEFSCLDYCKSMSDCLWFTFDPQTKFCEALSSCPVLDPASCPNCLSGSRDCHVKDPVCWVQGECQGILDQFQPAENMDSCLNLCKNTSGCRWFTFQEPSLCLLFKTCSTLSEDCETCISGEKRCPNSKPKMSKLLVAGGTRSSVIEIINLDESKPNMTCQNLPDLPLRIMNGLTGQLWNGTTPLICGGYDMSDYISECFALSNNTWERISDLKIARSFSRSVILGSELGSETMLVIGGSQNHVYISEVETFQGSTWELNITQPAPFELTQHCVAKINDTYLISLGGISSPPSEAQKSFFYNLVKNEWSEGPTMIVERNGPACTVIDYLNPDSQEKEKVVVVFGGDNINSTEILFLNNEPLQWVFGPGLPSESFLGTMIEYEGSAILLGGEGLDDSRTMYKLDSVFGNWVKMPQQLSEPTKGHVSFLIPDELTNCI